MIPMDVNRNASRIYQELLQTIPRRKSVNALDAASPMMLQCGPNHQAAAFRRTLTTSRHFSNCPNDASLEDLLGHRPESKTVDLQSLPRSLPHASDMNGARPLSSRFVRSPAKQRSLASQIALSNHQNAAPTQPSRTLASRCIPRCFEPMTSYLVEDLAIRNKSASSKNINFRTKRGECLTMRVMRVCARFPMTEERVASKTILYVFQGSARQGNQVLRVGQSREVPALGKLLLTTNGTDDGLVLVISDSLNAYNVVRGR